MEMGGKTGTTNDNSDAWYMGFTPQLLAGTWIGCDDRFIRNESNSGFGGAAARPIWEAFFKKVYADRTLGIDKEAKFVKPEELENEINSADPANLYDDAMEPGAEGIDQGVGTEEDYMNNPYIGPESKPVTEDDDAPIRKDSSRRNAPNKDGETKPIGAPAEEPEKKKGFLKKIFGKKEKEQ